MSAPRTVAIIGGSFDPPHEGHRWLGERVLAKALADDLWYVPTMSPPHKDRVLAPYKVRVRALEVVIAGLPACIKDIERDGEGPRYTVDMIERLHALHPGTRWLIVIGTDQANAFWTWSQPDRILELATIVVVERAGYTLDQEIPGSIHLAGPGPNISSTMLRNAVKSRIYETPLLEV